jgi:cytochrome c553
VRFAALVVSSLVLVVALATSPSAQQQAAPITNAPGIPAFAYPVAPGVPAPKDDGTVFHVPNSTIGMTRTQATNPADVPDWHPDDHPPMPDVVRKGARGVRACGYCHYPNGLGRPENASVAGLSKAYIIQQVHDFAAGLRKSSEPGVRPPVIMADTAKAISDQDLQIAADYFSSLKLKPWVKVVESKTAPKTEIRGGMFLAREGAEKGMEPIGDRIVEVPVDAKLTEELRDAGSPFIAYVPPGSIAKGEALVTTGGAHVVGGKVVAGKTAACATCHGPDLTGYAGMPPIAGRSPSYIVRQLFDMQKGNRNGPNAKLMKPVVANLTIDDMIDIAAYVSSRSPIPSASPTSTTAQR